MITPMRRREDHPPRRLRKGMYLLPSLFTTANLAAGFYAISQAALGASHVLGRTAVFGGDPLAEAATNFNYSAIAIGFAVFFDGMDGAIARLTHTTSDFGKELDSLADVVTFGVAPGILAWLWGFFFLPYSLDGEFRNKLIQFGGICAFAFLTAGACRLARFNIQLNPVPKNPGRPGGKFFVGMPIPAGAGCLAAVVHLRLGAPLTAWWGCIVWMLFMVLCAFLMVSTWRFWSAKSLDLRSRKAARLFVFIGTILTAIWYFHRFVLFGMAVIYLSSGIYSRVAYSLRRHGSHTPPAPPEEAVSTL
jgi:CDP-diacylglycerol--serine O-phosphatidyltransferase